MSLATLTLPLVLGLGFALAPRAEAEIFKCAGHRALPTYQNFPCEYDSLGAASATPGRSPPSPGLAVAPDGAVNRYAPVAQRRATPASAQTTIPRVGMTSDEVRRIWGEPAFMTTEEHAKTDIERWTYADSRSVVFDRKGIVTSIDW